MDLESCYRSYVTRLDGCTNLGERTISIDLVVLNVTADVEICYNTRENLSFDLSDDLATPDPKNVLCVRDQKPLYFRYTLEDKESVYMLGNGRKGAEKMVKRLSDNCKINGDQLHPFTLHLAIMYKVISERNEGVLRVIKTLLAIENHVLDGSLISMNILGEFRAYVQQLHEISRQLIIIEHYNDRDKSTVGSLLKDMDRLERETNKLGNEYAIDADVHERAKDGLLCLQDFCMDRVRRLHNLKQRVQNLITLVRF